MGANQSSSIRSVTEILNKNITNVLSEQTINVSGRMSNVNKVRVEIGKLIGCKFQAVQTISGDQKIKSIASIQSAADLANVMKNALDKTVDSDQTSVNGFMSTAFSNQQDVQDIKNTLHNIVENNIKNVNTSNILAISDNLNKGVYKIGEARCEKGQGSIDISQDTIVAQYVESLGNLTGEVLSKDQRISSAVEKISASQKSKNAGFAEFVKSATGLWSILIVGFLIFAFLFFKFGGLDKLEKVAGAGML